MAAMEGQVDDQVNSETEPIQDAATSPPSYDSVKGRLAAARADSSSNADFICQAFYVVFCGRTCVAIYLVLNFVLPIAMLVIGVIQYHECPVEPFIPLYLVVAGSGGIVTAIINTATKVTEAVRRQKKGLLEDEEEKKRHKIRCTKTNPILCLLNTFLFGWFVAGTYWVFHVYTYRQNQHDHQYYCADLVYLFSFCLIIAGYAALFLIICCYAGLSTMLCFPGRKT